MASRIQRMSLVFPKQKMRQLVLEHAHDAEFATARRDDAQGSDDIFHPGQTFLGADLAR